MDTVKGVLILLTILLTLSTFYLFVQASSKGAQLENARYTNQLAWELVRVQGGACVASKTDFTGVAKCIEPLLLTKNFKEDSFAQPSDRTGQGYLVIKNVNAESFESANFTFSFNRQTTQQGCTIPGPIGQGITCRFNFDQRCEKGDVLEVEYTKGNRTSKVFTKTC